MCVQKMRTRSQTTNQETAATAQTPERPRRDVARSTRFADETFVKGNIDQYERGYDRGDFWDPERDDRCQPDLDFVVADEDFKENDQWGSDSDWESDSDSDSE